MCSKCHQIRSGCKDLVARVHLPSFCLASLACRAGLLVSLWKMLIFLSVLLKSGASTPLLPPLVLSSSDNEYSYQYSPTTKESVPDSTPYTSFNPPTAPPRVRGECRYCGICQCRQPTDEDGRRFSSWIEKYLYGDQEERVRANFLLGRRFKKKKRLNSMKNRQKKPRKKYRRLRKKSKQIHHVA